MNLNSLIYSTLLQNKFVNLVVVFVHLRFWSLSRPKRIWLQWYTRGVWEQIVSLKKMHFKLSAILFMICLAYSWCLLEYKNNIKFTAIYYIQKYTRNLRQQNIKSKEINSILKLFVAQWCHMATYNLVNIGSGNVGWRHQAITETNVD